MKKILKKILRFFAVKIVPKYQPEIVAITGSVGKTSTKEAIYTVLASSFNVRTNIKNYNNEIGIPLTIINAKAAGKSLIGWVVVFAKAIGLLIKTDKNYPKILVLEMGADHPGDIKYLTGFLPIKVGVITAVAPVHLEFFKTLEEVAKEKGSLIKALPKSGFAILNQDDKLVFEMKKNTNATVLTFGLIPQAEVRASEIAVSHEVDYKDVSTIQGISFKLNHKGSVVPVLLPSVLGEHLVLTALAAIAVGLVYKINLHTIIESLKTYEPPKGRMHIISGIKNTLIIDDTYNSSPLAAAKALHQLSEINLDKHHKKYAVLGDMLELGSYTEQAHQELGQAVFDYKIDYLITVGEISRDIVRGAVKAGMSKDNCFNFKNSLEAAKFLQDRIAEGDLILIKGSQGVRMEKAVKELMAEPEKAEDLLVRQGKEWQ
ncbi:MAG: UDP-N-acetylmuramoyl-tripeptide--D-alanyl-D-alanine ligase [Candidatus Buchananbacteria bacterium]